MKDSQETTQPEQKHTCMHRYINHLCRSLSKSLFLMEQLSKPTNLIVHW